jgi:Holliday junction resolvase
VPLVAVRFAHHGWWFIEPEKLESTKKGLAVSLEEIQKKGKSFEELVK